MTNFDERTYPLLHEARALADDILNVDVKLRPDVVLRGSWEQVAFASLAWSSETLETIRMLSTPEDHAMHTAYILVRSSFELSMQLEYLHKHRDEVPDFIQHNFQEPTEDGKQLMEYLQEGKSPPDNLYESLPVPRRSWKPMVEICKALGRLNEFYTLYAFTSTHSHGGAYGMGDVIARLLGEREVLDWEISNPLYSALTYHFIIIEINIDTFSDLTQAQTFSNFAEGTEWRNRLGALGEALRDDALRQSR